MLTRILSKLAYSLLSLGSLCNEQLVAIEKQVVDELKYRWFVEREAEAVGWEELLEAFTTLYNLDKNSVWFFACDPTYLVPRSRSELEEWTRLDWTNKLPYTVSTFDCDNFAALFAVRTRLITGWAVTWTVGEIRRVDNNEVIGYHSFCTCYYMDGDRVRAVCYEPQCDEFSEDARFTIYEQDGTPVEVCYRPIGAWPQVTV